MDKHFNYKNSSILRQRWKERIEHTEQIAQDDLIKFLTHQKKKFLMNYKTDDH